MSKTGRWRDADGGTWRDTDGVWRDSGAPEAAEVASIVVPQQPGPFPANHPIYLYFLLLDSNGDAVTGETIGDFTLVRIDNGQAVDPHLLYMTEVGSGWYFLGTAAGSAFTATVETHVVIDILHTDSGVRDQMVFSALYIAHERYLLQ